MESPQEIPPNSNTNYINLADLDTSKQGFAIHHTNEALDPEQVYHCLCPRGWRTVLAISVPDTIDKQNMITTVLPQMIQESAPTYLNIILKTECGPHITKPSYTTYKITTLSIHDQIIGGMRSNNIKQCIFYVGFSKNNREFLILNAEPHDKEIVKFNYKEEPVPYQTEIITI
jgi:hypothetical protein